MLCPKCDYDLTGLPDRHICPECGGAYDKKGRLLRFRRDLRRERWLMQFGIAVSAVYAWWAWNTGPANADYWVMAFLLSGVAWNAYRIWSSRRKPTQVILSEQGVTIERPGCDVRTIPWPSLNRAKLSWVFGRLQLIGHDGTLLSIRAREFGGLLSASACAKEINRFVTTLREERLHSDELT